MDTKFAEWFEVSVIIPANRHRHMKEVHATT